MPLTGSRRVEALAGHIPRRRPWRIRLAALISLLVHVTIGLLLLLTIRHEGTPELLPPPAAVTMLFETGRKSGPTLPNPELQATPSTPPPAEAAPTPAPPLPPAVAPPTPAPLTPAPPAPPAPVPAKPAPPAEAPPVPAPPLPAPVEAPPVPSPPVPAPPVEVSPPPVEQAPLPLPPPMVKPPPSPSPSRAPKAPARPPTRRVAPARPSAFPAPMNFSFGKPNFASPSAVRPRSTVHIPGTIDMSLGPAARGKADLTPLSQHDADAAGADWSNELSQWVSEHAFYPDEARRNFEEGDVTVHVRANPDGRVTEVELIGRSGSMWLDMALLALFRDQHIPALPAGDHDPIDFNFLMHYILVRPP